jgi:hypothetical protein
MVDRLLLGSVNFDEYNSDIQNSLSLLWHRYVNLFREQYGSINEEHLISQFVRSQFFSNEFRERIKKVIGRIL